MMGTAVFEAGMDGFISYHETVLLRLATGGSFDAERRYLYAARPDGFTVYFFETPPRLFHEISLVRDQSDWVGGATHMCGADIYDSHYVFAADAGFSVSHRVRGPRKNYLSHTVFKRRLPLIKIE